MAVTPAFKFCQPYKNPFVFWVFVCSLSHRHVDLIDVWKGFHARRQKGEHHEAVEEEGGRLAKGCNNVAQHVVGARERRGDKQPEGEVLQDEEGDKDQHRVADAVEPDILGLLLRLHFPLSLVLLQEGVAPSC